MRITRIRAFAPRGARPGTSGGSWLSESRIANPMSIYPEYAERRSSWNGPPQSPVYVKVETDEGITGWGRGGGGLAATAVIEGHFAPLLEGKDPFDIEKLWDIMWRASMPYGRKGLAIHALSGVDVALWDVVGKAKNEPVWRLLGGLTKDRVPVYSTNNDVALTMRHGVRRAKLAMPYGPADGWQGMQGNVEHVRRARELLGPDGELMLDCYMAWNVEYTLRMAELLEPLRIRWIEEFLPPDDYDGHAEVKRQIRGMAVATGEHEYTRWGHLELLKRNAVDILQPDVHWCGGITELKRIGQVASAFNIPVIPHAGGGSAEAQAVVFSSVNCPLFECFFGREPGEPRPPALFEGLAEPEEGYIRPWTAPGLGLAVNAELFERTFGEQP